MKKLVKQEIKDILALTPMQEGILFHYLKDPDKGYYFEQLQLCIRGDINLPHFEKAWHRVTAANEMLRTCFRWEKLEKPIQIVLREHRPHIQYHDLLLSEASAEEREKRLEQIKITDRETPFDLGNVPFRIILCKTASQHYQMIVSSHHILYDGWSSGIILKEFFEAYNEAGLAGIPIPTAPKPCFKNFVSWLRHRDPEQEKEFWTNYLKDFDTATELRLKEPAAEEKTKTGMQQYELAVTDSLKQNLETFVKEKHVTTAAVLYTAWGLLLQNYADRDDVVFGTTVAGRPAAIKQVEKIVGLFINTIPLRLRTAPGDTVAALVAETDKQIQDRAPYENTSLVDIKGCSDMDDGESLFDSIVVIENYPIDNALVPAATGLAIDSYGMYEMTHFDLTLTIELLTKINIKLAWNGAKFETGTMENMVRHFNAILTGMLEDPGWRADGLELLSPEEKRQLIYDFNDTATDYPSDKTIAQLIEEQTHRTPFRTALAGRENLSFAELDRQASQLARLLLENGVRRGHIVAFMMNRSNDLLIAMLGILKAGGAYLPIDTNYSAQRAAYMLEDSSAALLISNLETPPPLAGIPVIRPEAAREAKEKPHTPDITASPEDLAYILYTSGSTGKPKGVMIENRPFVNFIKGITDIIPFETTDRILSLTTVSFDIFGLESLLALSQGSTVILGNEEEQRDAFLGVRLMERENITIFQATPSRLQVFIQSPNLGNGFKRLRSLIIGGEALPPALLEKLETLTLANIYNVYGPTETTVWSTIRQVNGNRRLNIGKPIANTTVYILNRWGLHQPVGAAGELVIGGHGLARGYLNRPELTAEKFAAINRSYKTYKSNMTHLKEDRFYRTGDLARRLPDGDIEFLGRFDDQVKIRGFRIEPGEIENRLLTHEKIKEAAVLAKDGPGGDKYLTAYYVLSAPVSEQELREFLLNHLPEYMVPAYFMSMDAFPLTASGKTNRKLLPEPDARPREEYIAPANALEESLVSIWADVLGLEKDRIGVNFNFFRLGGHSLKAASMIARVHKLFQVNVPLARVFENPAIRGMAAYIERAARDKHEHIPYAAKQDVYPLSSAQKRLYVLYRMEPDGLGYNIPSVFLLRGRIDRERLENTFKQLIQRHQGLRTAFYMKDGEPVQEIHEVVPFAIETILPKAPESSPEQAIASFIRPFDLNRPPLLRVGLMEQEPGIHLLLIDMHHIISDGTSMRVLADEFMALTREETLPPLRLQYIDYSQWRNSDEQKKALQKQEQFWIGQFDGDIPVLDLPLDYTRPNVQQFDGSGISFEIPPDKARALNALALENGVTMYMVLLGLFSILQAKLSGQEEIIIGSPVAGRGHADLENIIGMFVNTLAIRTRPEGEKTFKDFLADIKQTALNAFENQDYPYEELVEKIGVTRDTGRNPLFDVMFVLQNTGIGKLEIPGLSITPYAYQNKSAKFDLSLIAEETGETIRFTLEYCTALFKEETIERFATYFNTIINGVLEAGNPAISCLPFITGEEKQRILFRFNDTAAPFPEDTTMVQLFANQVERTPDAVALTGPAGQISYNELRLRSLRTARALKNKGVGPDSIVAVKMERSPEMMIAIFAVVAAGGAYLPIDPAYPADRIDFILADSRALLCINSLDNIEEEHTEFTSGSQLFPAPPDPSSLAYVIYTSGTTGRPKGVVIEHRSLVNRLCWQQKQYPIHPGDTVLQKTTYTFDVSVWELFWWSMRGAKLCLLPHGGEKDPAVITRVCERYFVNVLHFVPSMLSVFLDYINTTGQARRLSALRRVITSGEALQPNHVRLFNRLLNETNGTLLGNLYGPTEATIDVSYFNCPPDCDKESIPIGKPIDNTQLYILDRYGNLQPVGIAGELVIAGVNLARGYLNRPELTAEKFNQDFQDYHDDQDKKIKADNRLYRTGDLARWLPDGDIEYLGRIDSQVKIRGFRIELGEIENRLLSYTAVKEAAVIARKDSGGDSYLCAYFVPQAPCDAMALREHLALTLPDYMIPSYFIQLERIPVTHNGKLDRKSLPAPDSAGQRSSDCYVAPGSPVEEILARTWQDVLGGEKIGIHDNFFLIGGDSIKAIQIISRLTTAGYKLEMKDLFRFPVISKLAAHVKKTKRLPQQTPVYGQVPLTPIQHRFFSLSLNSPHFYNQSVMLHSARGFDEEILKKVLTQLILHHDAMRMHYESDAQSGTVRQINREPGEPPALETFDLRGISPARQAAVSEQHKNRVQACFDLAAGSLLKAALLRMSDGDRLLLSAHHLVIDGVSWRILLEDFRTLYDGYLEGLTPSLPAKTDSYKLWAGKLATYAQSEALVKEIDYWRGLESRYLPSSPLENIPREILLKDTGDVSFSLAEEDTRLLLTTVNSAYNTEINDILLTALGMSLNRAFNMDIVPVALEGHGREEILADIDISRTVGWFTSLYPVLLDMSHADDLHPGRLIKEVKETLRRIPNKGIGYGILRYLTPEELKKDMSFNLEPRIIFNYLGRFDRGDSAGSSFEITRESTGVLRAPDNAAEYLLDVSGITVDNRLTMTIAYNRACFSQDEIAALATHFKAGLKELIHCCAAQETAEPTPGDFTYPRLTIEEVEQLTRSYPGIDDIYTLTPMQQGLLYHSLQDSAPGAYFEQMGYRIHGPLSLQLVKQSLEHLFQRHDILRTNFVFNDVNRPVQVVLNHREPEFYYRDLRDLAEPDDRESLINQYKENDRNRPFDLTRDVLLRVSVFRTGGEEYEVTWSFHHILMDGWCVGILNKEFLEIYHRLVSGSPAALPTVKPYKNYIRWLENRDEKAAVKHWHDVLEGFDLPTGVPVLPDASPEGSSSAYSDETVALVLSSEDTTRLSTFAASRQVTMNTLLQAVWGILLAKYNRSRDVVFGAVVSGRPADLEGVESMVGLFINTIPVRVRFEKDDTFQVLLSRLQEQATAAEPYHYSSLSEIQSAAGFDGTLVDHVMVHENYPIAEYLQGYEYLEGENTRHDDSLKISSIKISELSNYNFNLLITGTNQLSIHFKYNADVYHREQVERTSGHVLQLITGILENENRLISDLELLTPAEKQQILHDFNHTQVEFPEVRTLHRLFEEQVARTPDALALVKRGPTPAGLSMLQFTYAGLNRQAERVARILRQKGVRPDSIVALHMAGNAEMIIGMLGILKAGGAYMPIDIEYPRERRDYMLKDSGASIVLDQEAIEAAVHAPIPDIIAPERPTDSTMPHNLAYVIYTSGSTGKPKGVMVKHEGIYNSVYWHTREYRHKPGNRSLQMFSFAFDGFLTSFFPPIVSGAVVIQLSSDEIKDVTITTRIIAALGVTHTICVPSVYRVLLDNASASELASLKMIILAGEQLAPDIVEKSKQLNPRLEVVNEYGPTEASVVATYNRDVQPGGYISIGKPVSNVRVFILDENEHPVPIGIPGQLAISGSGLARGYLNRPELTAEKFNQDFQDKKIKADNRLYLTGDLARWLPNGEVDFLGRIDEQVKIRGYRIELGEIENRLRKHPNVKEAVVLCKQDQRGDKYLCGWFTPAEDSGETVDSSLLTEYMAAHLPHYMVPAYFTQLSQIPLTANGKLNSKALPEPQWTNGENYMAPRNAVEKQLCTIWAGVLGLEDHTIGIQDNFFALGGNSIKATMLLGRIHKQFHVGVPMTQLFKSPSIKALAQIIQTLKQEILHDIEPVGTREYYELSPAQRRMYIMRQFDTTGTNYHVSLSLELIGTLDTGKIESIFQEIISRHESFRTSFITVDDKPVQVIHDHVEFKIKMFDLPGGSTERSADEVNKIISGFIRPFDLSQAPLARAALIKTGRWKHILLFDMHHIITDGASLRILTKDFRDLYLGKEPTPLKIRYKDFSHWLSREKEMLKKEEEYWLKKFANEKPVLKLPFDFPDKGIQAFDGRTAAFQLGGETFATLKEIALAENATVFLVILAIYNIFLSMICGQDDILVGTVVEGRKHPDLEHIVGMFVNTLALRNFVDQEKTFTDFLDTIKTDTLEAFENQDYQYDDLVAKVAGGRNQGRHPLCNVGFSFHTDRETQVELPGLRIKPYEYKQKAVLADLFLDAVENEDCISFVFSYCASLFKPETIERFIDYFNEIAATVARNTGIPIKDISLTHDLFDRELIIPEDEEGDFEFE